MYYKGPLYTHERQEMLKVDLSQPDDELLSEAQNQFTERFARVEAMNLCITKDHMKD